MSKNWTRITIIITMFLILSSCGQGQLLGHTPSITITNTSIPTNTPAPSYTPTPTRISIPTPSDPWSVPFLNKTPSDKIHLMNCSDVTITGKQFVNIADVAIIVEQCNNVTITGNDFSNVVGGIFILDSTNVTVTWNRYENIGDGTFGSGHSNFVQFAKSFGGYIAHNKGIGGNTEDIISIFQSGGSSASSPLIIEYNAFQGTNWSSESGSGSMMGDSCGAHMVIRFNTYLSPGQSGIGIACGTDIHITDNIIYGEMRPLSNVGIYIWNQYTGECSGNEIARNQVRWYRYDGVENPYWNSGNCGVVAGESTNNWHADLDPAQLEVKL